MDESFFKSNVPLILQIKIVLLLLISVELLNFLRFQAKQITMRDFRASLIKGKGGGAGTDPGFFLGGDAPLRNGVTDWSRKPILIQNTSCIRKPQVISGGGCGLGAQPLHSPPRSAPDLPFKPYTLTDGDTLF